MTCNVAVCTLPSCGQLCIPRWTVCEPENPKLWPFVIPQPWKWIMHVLTSIAFSCREINKKKKRRKNILGPLVLRLLFEMGNNKVLLNILSCAFWWLLDTCVSCLQVHGQVMKEAEWICAMQNRIRWNCTGWHRALLWWQYLRIANWVSAGTPSIQKDAVPPRWWGWGSNSKPAGTLDFIWMCAHLGIPVNWGQTSLPWLQGD